MSEPNDFNAKIIDEYRANGGKVGMFPNGSLLLLRSTRAKSAAPANPANPAGQSTRPRTG